MGILQRTGRLQQDLHRIARRESTILLNMLRQILPLDKLHCEVRDAFGVVCVVSDDDVRMRQSGNRLGLSTKAFHNVRGLAISCVQNLEANNATQLSVPGLKNTSHSPFAQRLQHFVITQHQVLMPPLQQRLGLKARKVISLHQCLRKTASVRRLQLVQPTLQVVRRQQSAAASASDKRLQVNRIAGGTGLLGLRRVRGDCLARHRRLHQAVQLRRIIRVGIGIPAQRPNQAVAAWREGVDSLLARGTLVEMGHYGFRFLLAERSGSKGLQRFQSGTLGNRDLAHQLRLSLRMPWLTLLV